MLKYEQRDIRFWVSKMRLAELAGCMLALRPSNDDIIKLMLIKYEI
jgi:hypothetical protein